MNKPNGNPQSYYDQQQQQQQPYAHNSHQYNENYNGRMYPRSAPAHPHQNPFNYSTYSHRSNQQQFSTYTCFICGQMGHIKAQCPQRSQSRKPHQ